MKNKKNELIKNLMRKFPHLTISVETWMGYDFSELCNKNGFVNRKKGKVNTWLDMQYSDITIYKVAFQAVFDIMGEKRFRSKFAKEIKQLS